MSRYKHSPEDPRPHEAVEALAEHLRKQSEYETALAAWGESGGSDNIYTHNEPAQLPASGKRLVVRARREVGPNMAPITGPMTVRVQVMAECDEETQNYPTWHAALQDDVKEHVLSDTLNLEIEHGALASAITRTRRPGPPAYDARDGAFYTTSEFSFALDTG